MGKASNRMMMIAQILGGIGQGIVSAKDRKAAQDKMAADAEAEKRKAELQAARDARAERQTKVSEGQLTLAQQEAERRAKKEQWDREHPDSNLPSPSGNMFVSAFAGDVKPDDPMAVGRLTAQLQEIERKLQEKELEMSASPAPDNLVGSLQELFGATPGDKELRALEKRRKEIRDALGVAEYIHRGGLQGAPSGYRTPGASRGIQPPEGSPVPMLGSPMSQGQSQMQMMPSAPGSAAVDTNKANDYLHSWLSIMGAVKSGQDPTSEMFDPLWHHLGDIGLPVPAEVQARWQGINPATGQRR
jgi:hypothetical protein